MIVQHHLVFGRKYTPKSLKIMYNNSELQHSDSNILYTTGRNGKNNEAFSFNNSEILTASIDASSVYSFSFWVKVPSVIGSNFGFFTSWNYVSTDRIPLAVFNSFSGTRSFSGGIGMPGVQWLNVGTTKNTIIINDDTWKHIVLIIDSTMPANDEVKIYVNNVLQSINKPLNSDTSLTFKSLPLRIGKFTGTNDFIGYMQDFKIFNHALTQTEINNLYNE